MNQNSPSPSTLNNSNSPANVQSRQNGQHSSNLRPSEGSEKRRLSGHGGNMNVKNNTVKSIKVTAPVASAWDRNVSGMHFYN